MKHTITIKTPRVEESTIDIELPCWTKHDNNYYFVEAGNKITSCINIYGYMNVCRYENYMEVAFKEGFEYITREEYQEQFNKVMEILKRD